MLESGRGIDARASPAQWPIAAPAPALTTRPRRGSAKAFGARAQSRKPLDAAALLENDDDASPAERRDERLNAPAKLRLLLRRGSGPRGPLDADTLRGGSKAPKGISHVRLQGRDRR